MNYFGKVRQSGLLLLFGKGGVRFTLGIAIPIFLLSSCEEIGPSIDLTGTFNADTTYVTTDVETSQTKNVLLEEFTGVRCVNCPEGHVVLDNLETLYGSRFIGVSVHSKFQAEPYNDDQDLHTVQADSLEKLLGPLIAKPSGAIDRKKFPGDSLMVFKSKWVSYVVQQMSELSTPLNIHIETEYVETSRQLRVVITLHYTTEDTLASKMTVMLIEHGIITSQLTETGMDNNYVQNRVLRQILPSTSGMPLPAINERGRVIVKSFSLMLPDIWVAENLHVVAFVNRTGQTLDVVQAEQSDVK